MHSIRFTNPSCISFVIRPTYGSNKACQIDVPQHKGGALSLARAGVEHSRTKTKIYGASPAHVSMLAITCPRPRSLSSQPAGPQHEHMDRAFINPQH